MIITLLATAVVLGVLILVHELGHFVVAKLVDIEVPRFSIGLGPKLVGFRRGETEYVVSWIPLGGYVKMAGMEEMEALEGGPAAREEEERDSAARDEKRDSADREEGAAAAAEAGARREPGPRDFESKSLGARALVISAGVVMNVVLAFVIYTFSALVWGVAHAPPARIAHVDSAALPAGTEALERLPVGAHILAIGDDRVADWEDFVRRLATAPAGPTELRLEHGPALRLDLPSEEEARGALVGALQPVVELEPVIGAVEQGMPADSAGLKPGDRVVSAGGRPVRTWQDLVNVVRVRPRQATTVVVERDGQRLQVELTPTARAIEGDGTEANVGQIGVYSRIPIDHPGPVGAVVEGAHQTWYWVSFTVEFLAELVTGHASPRNLGGPILIGKLSGEMARAGLQPLLGFMALLSINLAIFNLLPIPVLDGGHLLFLGVEAVRGRALSIEQRARLSQVGLLFLVALMVWVVANDVLRLIGI